MSELVFRRTFIPLHSSIFVKGLLQRNDFNALYSCTNVELILAFAWMKMLLFIKITILFFSLLFLYIKKPNLFFWMNFQRKGGKRWFFFFALRQSLYNLLFVLVFTLSQAVLPSLHSFHRNPRFYGGCAFSFCTCKKKTSQFFHLLFFPCGYFFLGIFFVKRNWFTKVIFHLQLHIFD